MDAIAEQILDEVWQEPGRQNGVKDVIDADEEEDEEVEDPICPCAVGKKFLCTPSALIIMIFFPIIAVKLCL